MYARTVRVVANWEGAKASAEANFQYMRTATANPEQKVSVIAFENGAIVTAQAMAKEGDRNLKYVKAFKVRYSQCFKGNDHHRFDTGVGLVRASFVERANAMEHLLGAWGELQFADVAGAERSLKNTPAEPPSTKEHAHSTN